MSDHRRVWEIHHRGMVAICDDSYPQTMASPLAEPCPFCHEVYETNEIQHRLGHYNWHCQNCHADGPPAATIAEAFERWNNRPAAERRTREPRIVYEFNPTRPMPASFEEKHERKTDV